MTALEILARKEPAHPVRLLFRNDKGTGYIETTAREAVQGPNASQRWFPPQGETAATLAWPVPWWYATEAYAVVILP